MRVHECVILVFGQPEVLPGPEGANVAGTSACLAHGQRAWFAERRLRARICATARDGFECASAGVCRAQSPRGA